MLMAEAETEAETEDEAMMREKAEGKERVRDQEAEKARAEDDMIKQVWRAKYLGSKTRWVNTETKSAVSEAQASSK